MEDYQLRVIEEYAELKIKIDKLNTFLRETQDTLMSQQLDCMYKYIDILKARMKQW